MDCNILSPLLAFRKDIYACFGTAQDALFDVCDTLLTGTQAHSFVELSLSPTFARRWSSLYHAVQDAKIDRDALRKAFAAQVAAPTEGKRLVLGIDARSIARPQSPTARDRTYVHASNLPPASVPTTRVEVKAKNLVLLELSPILKVRGSKFVINTKWERSLFRTIRPFTWRGSRSEKKESSTKRGHNSHFINRCGNAYFGVTRSLGKEAYARQAGNGARGTSMM